jgi:hypothetical protein
VPGRPRCICAVYWRHWTPRVRGQSDVAFRTSISHTCTDTKPYHIRISLLAYSTQAISRTSIAWVVS